MLSSARRFFLYVFLITCLISTGLASGCELYVAIPADGRGREEPLFTEEISPEEITPEEPLAEEIPTEPECIDGTREPCDTGELGICGPGQRICANGRFNECKRLEEPSAELCDNIDNDCDGKIDEEIQRACYTGPAETRNIGICRDGRQVCNAGQWSPCLGDVTPIDEVCDGRDNNCNGQVDEFLPIQQIGTIRNYSNFGDFSHLYMVSTPAGYAFGWSERPLDVNTGQIRVTGVRVDGSREGSDWPVTSNGEKGNIHGLAWMGNGFAVAWDTDQSRGENISDAYLSTFDPQGRRLRGPLMLEEGGRAANTGVVSGAGLLAASWVLYGNNASEGFLRLQIFNTNLQPQGGISPLSSDYLISPDSSPFPTMAYSGDQLAVSWVSNNLRLRLGLFDRTGKPVNSFFDIPNAGLAPRDPAIAGYNDGYLLTWVDLNSSPPGALWALRLNRQGRVVAPAQLISVEGAQTPLIRPTSFGAVVAWYQQRNGQAGISIGRVDRDGKLLAPPSWVAVPLLRPYLALAWTDLGGGAGRGAIAWIETDERLRVNRIMVAPLGCR